jgi:hypothetical protein
LILPTCNTHRCHHPRKRVIQYSRDAGGQSRSRGVLDTPLSRGMTAVCEGRAARLIRPTGNSCMAVMRKLPVVLICRTPLVLPKTPNHQHPSRHPALSRGAYRDRHGRWVRDAVDAATSGAQMCATNDVASGRRSRVVLAPRRWRQVCGNTRRRRWQQSPVTGESTE